MSLHKDISVLVVVKKKKDIYVLASQTIPKLTRRSIESIPYLNVACMSTSDLDLKISTKFLFFVLISFLKINQLRYKNFIPNYYFKCIGSVFSF